MAWSWFFVEPGRIQIAGTKPEDIWKEWHCILKDKLTMALVDEIGEPKKGYDFKY